MDRKAWAGIVITLIMALSSAGFVMSFGSSAPRNFQYSGRCTVYLEKYLGDQWLIYTLQDLNIPGTRQGAYLLTTPTPEVRSFVQEKNLLYWEDADLNVDIKGNLYPARGYVLPGHRPGDRLLADCSLVVSNGRVVQATIQEIPIK